VQDGARNRKLTREVYVTTRVSLAKREEVSKLQLAFPELSQEFLRALQAFLGHDDGACVVEG